MEINEYQSQIRDYGDYPLELGPFSVILSLQNNVGKLSAKLKNERQQCAEEVIAKDKALQEKLC
jgi:hypothetical protein